MIVQVSSNAFRSMPQFSDSSFGAVVDKGTMDAMACGEKAASDIHSMLSEISRQDTAHAACLLTCACM